MPSDFFESVSFNTRVEKYRLRIRTWTNTVNYKNVPRDDRPVNPYTDYRRSYQQIWYTGGYDRNNTTGVTTTTVPQQYTYSGTDLQQKVDNSITAAGFAAIATKVGNENLVQLLGKISDAKTNLAVTMAEARKTSDMILQTATRVANAYRAFRRGNFKEVARQLDIPPNRVHKTWLAYKYGWTPLLMDVKNSAEFFAQQTLGGRPPRFSVQVKKSVPILWVLDSTYAAYGGGSPGTYRQVLTGQYTNRMKVWVEVTNPNFSALQQLGLTNPLLVAWELVPFSFVFDWFCHVGNYLQGLTALHGLTIRRALTSNINEFSYSYAQPATSRSAGGHTYTNNAQGASGIYRDYGRSSLSIDPLALFPPVNADQFGFTKLVTSLALLRAVSR